MEDRLKGKTLVALGDSLIYGSHHGNEITWVNKLGRKHEMTVFNYGKNGNTIAVPPTPEQGQIPMCIRYADMVDEADYVVVLGGANDHRLNVPIGENTDTEPTTFKGALRCLIEGLLVKYPRAKMQFFTNYHRKKKTNDIGLTEEPYVLGMEEICRLYSIPCYNNYYNVGISFTNEAQLSWIDEGVWMGIEPNRHFSDEAYNYLMERYEPILMAL